MDSIIIHKKIDMDSIIIHKKIGMDSIHKYDDDEDGKKISGRG
jgi:hypothetical protein